MARRARPGLVATVVGAVLGLFALGVLIGAAIVLPIGIRRLQRAFPRRDEPRAAPPGS